MDFAEKWSLGWFGCFFAFAFFDIATRAIPLPHSLALNFVGGLFVGFIGFAPMITRKL